MNRSQNHTATLQKQVSYLPSSDEILGRMDGEAENVIRVCIVKSLSMILTVVNDSHCRHMEDNLSSLSVK